MTDVRPAATRAWQLVCRSPYLVTLRNAGTGATVLGLAAPNGEGVYAGTPESLARVTDAGCACRREVCIHRSVMTVLRQMEILPDADPWAENFEVVYADAGGVTARISWDAEDGPFSAMIEVRNGYQSITLGSPLGGMPPSKTGLILKDGQSTCTCGLKECVHRELYMRARTLGWEPLTYDRAAAEAALAATIEKRTALTSGQSEYALESESIRIMRAPDGRRTWMAAIATDRRNRQKALMLEVETLDEKLGGVRVSVLGPPPLLKKRIGLEASSWARRGYREVWW